MVTPRAETPVLLDVIRAVARPRAQVYILNPTRPLLPDRAHPPLVAPDQHTYFELAICLTGQIGFVGHSATIPLQSGDAVVVKPGAWHYESYRRVHQPYRMFWLVVTPQLVNGLFTHYRRGSFQVMETDGHPPLDETARLKELAREVESQRLHWPIKAQALLAELLVDFDRRLRGTAPALQVHEPDPVRKLLRIAQARFREPLQIKALAKQVGLSADHLSRRFHATCGTTFKDYLNTIRIHHAQHLLSAGWSIKETAEECGFSDVYYFGRVFRDRCQTTPGKFQHRQ